MKFENAYILNYLWLIIPLGMLLFYFLKRKQKIAYQFVQEKLFQRMAVDFSKRKRFIQIGLILGVVLFSIVALARPQWGFEWQEVKREGLDVLLVVDVSKSMLAQDVKPNRLERTKLAILDLLKQLKGDRIGLVAFAGDAFLLCPLTVDYAGYRLSLNDLNVNTVPRGGTNLSRAIEEAISSYKDVPSKHKAVVIITDGDDLEGDPLKVARKTKEMGIKVYTVGIGSPDGELIQYKNQNGDTEFLKDSQGNFVKSRLNESLLQKISLETNGAYVRSSGAQFGLDIIYDRYLSQLEAREIKAQKEKRYFERFQIPLTIAFLLLLLATCINLNFKY